jgi:hypothetical protein
MKLKRKWPGIGILVIFIIFDVVMAASSGFFSGLFPSKNIYIYTAAVTAIGIAIASVLTLLCGKVCDYLETGAMAEFTGIKVLFWLLLISVILGGVMNRCDIIFNSAMEPGGKLSLYENAMVGVFNHANEYDLLSILYSDILNVILIFTGNKIVAALYFQIVLFTIFVICGALSCKLLLGNTAALVFAAFVSYMPVFTDMTAKMTLGTDELFYALFGIELLMISIFLRKASDGKYTSGACAIWYMVLGCAIGFMTYLDAGTIIVVLPLLLAGLFLQEDQGFEGASRLMFVILGGLVMFLVMIIQEEGLDRMDAVLVKWSAYYFHNLNTFSMFWTYTNYKFLYLIILMGMSGVFIGYFRNRRFENVSPLLLSTMIVFFGTPFFGATRMNDQIVVTIFFGFVLACLASLITTNGFDIENEEDAEYAHATAVTGIREVVNPTENLEAAPEEGTLEDGASEEYESQEEYYDDEDEELPEKELVEEPSEEEADTAPEEISELQEEPKAQEEPQEAPKAQKEPKEEPKEEPKAREEKPRYVPEGMVLPMGSEDEMDVEKSNIRMPEFRGKIGLARKNKPVEQPAVPKDDFDIPMKQGDDFDL